MKIALVADWLPVFAGAEHVLAEFHALWPQAPLFTTIANYGHLGPLNHADIRVSSLQKWYKLIGKHPPLLRWMPRALERMDLRGYDVIVSSSHAVGKGIIPPSSATHICYCHTPMRYAWEMEDEYLDDFRVPKILRPTIKKQLKRIRRWDLTTGKRVDHFIANSTTTAERIRRTYNRESVVIHPPVSDRFFVRSGMGNREIGNRTTSRPHESRPHEYYLAVGRLVPYKRFNLLIKTANEMKLPLKIAGRGQEEAKLKKLAGPTVEFLGFVPDDELPDLYANAKAVLFPQFEDAGVVPLEAQACGTPVIAYALGGVLDTVEDGVTGLFFREQTVAGIREAIKQFETMTFDPEMIRKHAEQFSSENFRRKTCDVVLSALSRQDSLSLLKYNSA